MILFDDVDLLCRNPPGVETDPYQEGLQSHKVVDCLVELVAKERQRGTACVLVATAETKAGLHPRLVESRGGQHVFGKIAVLHPPSAVCLCLCVSVCVWCGHVWCGVRVHRVCACASFSIQCSFAFDSERTNRDTGGCPGKSEGALLTESKAAKRAWTSDRGLFSMGPCCCCGAVPECFGAKDSWWGGGRGREGVEEGREEEGCGYSDSKWKIVIGGCCACVPQER